MRLALKTAHKGNAKSGTHLWINESNPEMRSPSIVSTCTGGGHTVQTGSASSVKTDLRRWRHVFVLSRTSSGRRRLFCGRILRGGMRCGGT